MKEENSSSSVSSPAMVLLLLEAQEDRALVLLDAWAANLRSGFQLRRIKSPLAEDKSLSLSLSYFCCFQFTEDEVLKSLLIFMGASEH